MIRDILLKDAFTIIILSLIIIITLIKYNNHKGWILKDEIWGVYKNEIYNTTILQPIIELYWQLRKLK